MKKQVQFTFWFLLFTALSGNSLSAQNQVPAVQEPVYFDVSSHLQDISRRPPLQNDALNRKPVFDSQSDSSFLYPSAEPLNVDSYCSASGGCDEHISRVRIGTIDNITTCMTGYGNYTGLSTSFPLNGARIVTINNGITTYPGDECGVWVDWNRDGDFTDAGETIAVSGSPGTGPYTATIDPPASGTIGACVMRVRITFNKIPDPCGIDPYGEVEDYTINLTPEATYNELV